MIYLYSGTPGSGKSLHCARVIYNCIKHTNCLVICNFPIKQYGKKKNGKLKQYFTDSQYERIKVLPNNELNPVKLIEIANEYWSCHKAKNRALAESAIRLFIDEAQIIFNSRAWMATYKDGEKNGGMSWTWFFSVHRHYGFEIVLLSQMDTSLDKQVRGLIEYNCLHRKIDNIGIAGWIFSHFFGGGMFYNVKIWYPQKQRIGGNFFKFRKKFDDLYDTHSLFTKDGGIGSVIQYEE